MHPSRTAVAHRASRATKGRARIAYCALGLLLVLAPSALGSQRHPARPSPALRPLSDSATSALLLVHLQHPFLWFPVHPLELYLRTLGTTTDSAVINISETAVFHHPYPGRALIWTEGGRQFDYASGFVVVSGAPRQDETLGVIPRLTPAIYR